MKRPYRTNEPAAAGAATDAESGTEEDSVRRSLFALKAMLDRGLIDQAEYDRRRVAIEARS